MFNFISNHLKSICLRSMMHLCCKSSIHRRRSYYYVTYATVFIIFCLLVIAWMMILTQLSHNFDNKLSNTISIDTGNGDPKSSAEYLTPDLVESYRSEIVRLQTEIEELKKSQEKCASLMKHVGRQVDHMRRGGALSMSNEYEVMPFTHFTFTRIYPSSLALGKRVVEKPIGAKRKEIIDILSEALKLLSQFNRTVDDFIEGIYSNDPLLGTQYHLFFRTAKKGQSSAKFYHKVTLLRPFSPPKIVSNEIISTQREIINLILPISQDRLEHLTQFLENIQRLAKYESGRLKLFLVYFGQISQLKKYCCDQFSSGNSINFLNTNSSNNNINISIKKLAYINATAKQSSNNLISIKIIHVANDTLLFSRAKALHIGAEKCCKNSSLLFFCDVDLLFTTKFLERCRLNASKGKKVYYPILFSLYNPIYSRIHVPNMSNDMISPNLSNLISSQAGFWRDFGFGMTCQYKTDFVTVGGFSEYLLSNTDEQMNEFNRLSQFLAQSKLSSGWGGEDVLLYRRHLQHPKLSVIRAIDPGLFHIWHEKLCNANILTAEQYSSCLSTRALNEASHSQMAQHLMEMEIQKIKSSSN